MAEKKAWVWHGVLVDYTPGMAVVMAETKEEAFVKVREQKERGEIPGYVFRELIGTDPEPADGVEYVSGGG